MDSVIFDGERHRITTNGISFYLYMKSGKEKDCLLSQKKVDSEDYDEILNDLKSIVSLDIEEEEKILRICESGFFKIR